MPEFIEISLRIGPLMTGIVANEVVLLDRAVIPLAANARMTGKYSGRAPAMTALTATFSTVDSHASRNTVGRSRPTISSGGWLVPLSIASTRASVGSTIGSMSVQRFSTNNRCRSSSVSGSISRGVVRSNDRPWRSASSSGVVRPSSTSCMKGRPEIASLPSMYARRCAAD